MNILVTGSRLPFALEQIRKFGRAGHRVFATDSFWSAPGNHSRHATASFVTRSPAHDPDGFVADVARLVREHAIDRVVPSFEEAFYLSAARDRIEAELFAPRFETLALLHDKARLRDYAETLGIRVAPTILARSHDELERALAQFPRFFARPTFTRGGVSLFTNTGPLAGAMRLEDTAPSEDNPYLVQPFLEGRDLCSYSIVHHGRIAAHATYVHPLTLEHAGGITFESVVVPETLAIATRIAQATGYHGQLSFDFLETKDGIYLVECNPRPTAGLTVMPDGMFEEAMTHGPRESGPMIAPAGARRHMSLALLRNMVVHPETAAENAAALASSGTDIYVDLKDLMPVLSQFIAYGRVMEHRWRAKHSSRGDLMQGYFDDLTWNGAPRERRVVTPAAPAASPPAAGAAW
jgi:glutathione synthase/RimK-type ligase-like ATP-grasp enzyme